MKRKRNRKSGPLADRLRNHMPVYGVTAPNIRNIKIGKIWRHI